MFSQQQLSFLWMVLIIFHLMTSTFPAQQPFCGFRLHGSVSSSCHSMGEGMVGYLKTQTCEIRHPKPLSLYLRIPFSMLQPSSRLRHHQHRRTFAELRLQNSKCFSECSCNTTVINAPTVIKFDNAMAQRSFTSCLLDRVRTDINCLKTSPVVLLLVCSSAIALSKGRAVRCILSCKSGCSAAYRSVQNLQSWQEQLIEAHRHHELVPLPSIRKHQPAQASQLRGLGYTVNNEMMCMNDCIVRSLSTLLMSLDTIVANLKSLNV